MFLGRCLLSPILSSGEACQGGLELRSDDLRPHVRKAVITGEMITPGLLQMVAKNVGVWALLRLYYKEMGRKGGEDSPAV